MGRLCALVPQGCSVSSGLQVLRHWPPRGQAGLPVLETLCSVSGPGRVEACVNLPTSLQLPSKPWRRPCSPSPDQDPWSTGEVVWVQVLAPGPRLTLHLPPS